jgi:hypothetical protein
MVILRFAQDDKVSWLVKGNAHYLQDAPLSAAKNLVPRIASYLYSSTFCALPQLIREGRDSLRNEE